MTFEEWTNSDSSIGKLPALKDFNANITDGERVGEV